MDARLRTRGLYSGQDPASIGPLYLALFAAIHATFRIPEFTAAAEYYDIDYAFVPLPISAAPVIPPEALLGSSATDVNEQIAKEGLDLSRPFMLVHLPSDEAARQLCSRVTLLRSVWAHWATGSSLPDVLHDLDDNPSIRNLWSPFRPVHFSWRATVIGHNRAINRTEQLERIEQLANMLSFQGPIKMKGADVEWGYLEEWNHSEKLSTTQDQSSNGLESSVCVPQLASGTASGSKQSQRLLAVHVGRKVAEGEARSSVAKMDVKKRAFIGTTTMESQMSLIHAVMALAGPGKLVYDPFAGTGSILYAAAVMGANIMASDIDARTMKGDLSKDGKVGILRSAAQYGVEQNFIDCIGCDMTQHPWRRVRPSDTQNEHETGIFDAIVADPPYGVREGAKRLGRRDEGKQRGEAFKMLDGTFSHERLDYLPPSKPYALDDLIADLMEFASRFLIPKGRLVFWMPTMTEVDEPESTQRQEGNTSTQQLEVALPETTDFRLVAHSLQDFGVWGRRLITMEKLPQAEKKEKKSDIRLPEAPTSHKIQPEKRHNADGKEGRQRADADPSEFRNRYFLSLRKEKRAFADHA